MENKQEQGNKTVELRTAEAVEKLAEAVNQTNEKLELIAKGLELINGSNSTCATFLELIYAAMPSC